MDQQTLKVLQEVSDIRCCYRSSGVLPSSTPSFHLVFPPFSSDQNVFFFFHENAAIYPEILISGIMLVVVLRSCCWCFSPVFCAFVVCLTRSGVFGGSRLLMGESEASRLFGWFLYPHRKFCRLPLLQCLMTQPPFPSQPQSRKPLNANPCRLASR